MPPRRYIKPSLYKKHDYPARFGSGKPVAKNQSDRLQDNERARKLANALASLGEGLSRLTSTPNYKKWAWEFLQLSKHNVGDSRVDSVLAWLSGNAGKLGRNGFPGIRDAATFRSCFVWLEDMIANEKEKHLPPYTTTPEGSKITVDLTTQYRWPKGSEEQLPSLIENGLVFHQKMRKKLIAARDKYRAADVPQRDRVLGNLADELLHYLFDPKEFVRRWFAEVWRDVSNWKQWSGSLKSFALEDNERLGRKLADRAVRYSGNRKVWDKLKEEIAFES